LGDSNAEDRLLLGTVGWERPEWLQGYYPHDLPADWRLAYYANDCGCVLLPVDLWCGDPAAIEQALCEPPASLRFFLQMPARATRDARHRLEIFPATQTVLLVDATDPVYQGFRQWRARGGGVWVDTDSAASLVRWDLAAFDLRDLRIRAEALDSQVQALVLGGAGADPGRIRELRSLLELMGKA